MKNSQKSSYRGQNQQAQGSHVPSGEGPSYPPPLAMGGNGPSNTYFERGQLPSIQPPPQPMEGLQNNAMPPPFLTKTYVMVDDPATDHIVSWGPTNNSFVVWDPTKFAQELLPKYFKHANFASFVRQLNTYGFRKVDPDRWEFANEFFLRGQQHLLRGILRRKPNGHNSNSQNAVGPWVAGNGGGAAAGQTGSVVHAVELGKYGLEGEIERLKRDKNVLMMELVRLRQAQQGSEQQIRLLAQRLEAQEKRQQQMMSSLAQMMQNPTLLAQLMQQADKAQLNLNTTKKRRHAPPSEHTSLESDLSPPDNSGQIVMYQPQTQHISENGNDTLPPVHVQGFGSVPMATSPLESSSESRSSASDVRQFLTSTSGQPSVGGGGKTDLDEQSLNLFDDMVFEDSVKLFVDGNDMLSRRPSATLTEMHPSPPSGESDGPVDVPSQPPSPLQLPFDPVLDPSPLGHQTPSALRGLVGLDGSIALHTAAGDVPVDPSHLGIENMQLGPGDHESADVATAAGSSGVDATVNDGFWEQFLGPSPGGLENGELCDGCEESVVEGICPLATTPGGIMAAPPVHGVEGRGES